MNKRTIHIIIFALITLATLPAPVFAIDIGGEVGNLLAQLGALFFGFFALIFQKSITFLVFEIGQNMTGQLGFVVNTTWAIVRDLCNLVFIFLFLYVGVRLVLTVETVDRARTVLVKIIVAALLVNFSLFFAKAIIDIANVAAVAVYGLFQDASGEADVAAAVAASLGLHTWLGATAQQLPLMSFTKGVMMMIFFLVAALSFLTASVVLFKRYVILLFGMIVSPLVLIFKLLPTKDFSFMSSVVKKVEGLYSQFISSAFFPAVFLFLIYISLQIIKSYAGEPQFAKSILGEDENAVGTLLVYFIGIALLLASIRAASMVSDTAANMSMSFARKAGGAATLGVGAWAGRNLGGRLGKIAQEGLQNGKVPTTRVGRLFKTTAISGAEKMRTGSYDVRGTKAYAGAAKAAGVPVGGGWGVTDKGYEDVYTEKVKKEKELAEKQAAILAGVSKTEQEEKEKKAKEEFYKTKEALRDASSYRKIIEERNKAAGTSGTPEEAKARATELADADKAVSEALLKQRKAKEEHEKVKNEYKEKVENVLVGTKEARQAIHLEDTAAKHVAAEEARKALLAQREGVVANMTQASPEERAELQKKVDELEKKITEQETTIESAKVAGEKMVTAERAKKAEEATLQVKATETALTGAKEGGEVQAKLQAELASLQEKAAQAQQHVAAPAGRDTDVAQRMRDAAKAARNMRAKQGGIAGSQETEGAVGRALGGGAPFSSAGRTAGTELREKHKPKY